MTKQLALAAAFVFVAACKTDPPAQSNQPADQSPTSSVRSAKIDVKPVQPAAEQQPGADPALPPSQPPAEPHFRRNRKDINGEMTDEERAEQLKQRVAQMRQRLDTDGDGKLSVAELAAARGRMRFDNPAAIDTNHDGDISADELAAALQARREQWRQQRNGQVNGDTAPGSNGGNAAPANSDQ